MYGKGSLYTVVPMTDIYEGTGEIQRLIIARGLFDYTRADLK